jgi:hypothetical protein
VLTQGGRRKGPAKTKRRSRGVERSPPRVTLGGCYSAQDHCQDL